MPRFKLVPLEQESAMEQLWKAARMATFVIGRKHRWWHLYGEYLDEAVERIIFTTVTSFIENKVKRKTYSYIAKDGKKLTFFDNVLSACFGCAGNVIDRYIKELDLMNRTADIEEMKFCLSHADKLPIYVSDDEREARYKRKTKPERPCDRAHAVRKAYENYLDEFRELGLTGEPLELGPWLVRNGYGGDDDVFFYMESKQDRRKLLQGQARWIFEQKQAERDALIKNKSVLHAQVYNRTYKRLKRHEEWKRRSAEFEKLFGPPPEGHIWKERRGIVGLYKLKEEDK